ncbi:hypothetical protein Acsp02_05840 [Actinoplanes sp. NBRC 103695]|nr:hypothetical protein Acsp02_05840 [Actinoplanes sp. NBRC 103695]
MREREWLSGGGSRSQLLDDRDGSALGDRFESVLPRDLGIHSAIPTPTGDDELPKYVPRDFDLKLRLTLGANLPDRGAFVIMIGGSSSGKTRSLYEAVRENFPDWRLLLPADAADLLHLKNAPPRRTVFWLDELQRYLGSSPPLTAECVLALERNGNLVVGTLWPDQYAHWTATGEDVQKLVKRAVSISVPDRLSPTELTEAAKVARRDGRIRRALETRDAGMTQVLAGGPSLVMCWEQAATPYAKAIITAAADAHRLGMQSPLSVELLTGAMFGYLTSRERVAPTDHWLDEAMPHATRPLYGNVSALSPVDAGRAGTLGGYTVADYLAQHLRRVRRTEPVPHEAWQTLATRLRSPEDLRRLAESAIARLRYRYAEVALDRLAHEFDDSKSAVVLADLLTRQDRLIEAVRVLRHHEAAGPLVATKLAHLAKLQQRVDAIRPPFVRGLSDEVAELLADVGVCDDLRRDADDGDALAAERLIELLADRGCLRELRDRADRGERLAAEALADMYVDWGDEDLLMARARAGDEAAELRLPKLRRVSSRGENARFEIGALREKADEGSLRAALDLCTLFFDLRDEENLKAELDAGTPSAAAKLIALYTAREHPSLIHLRAFGLEADGQLVTPETQPLGVRRKDF